VKQLNKKLEPELELVLRRNHNKHNTNNTSEVPLEMGLLPKDSIKIIAEAAGVSSLPDEVAAAMASDVEYRIREITQVCDAALHIICTRLN
jgi:hypothetical protein